MNQGSKDLLKNLFSDYQWCDAAHNLYSFGVWDFSLTFFMWDSVHIVRRARINLSSIQDIIQFGLFELIIIAVIARRYIFVVLERLDLSASRFGVYVGISIIVLIVVISMGGSDAIDYFLQLKDFLKEEIKEFKNYHTVETETCFSHHHKIKIVNKPNQIGLDKGKSKDLMRVIRSKIKMYSY